MSAKKKPEPCKTCGTCPTCGAQKAQPAIQYVYIPQPYYIPYTVPAYPSYPIDPSWICGNGTSITTGTTFTLTSGGDSLGPVGAIA